MAAGSKLVGGTCHRQRIDAVMARRTVCPRRRKATSGNADRHLPRWPAAATVPRASHRRAAVALRGRARRANTRDPCRAAQARANRPSRRTRAPRSRQRRAGTRKNAVASVSSRRNLDRAGCGAAKTVGPVHVLDLRLRQHVASGRNRAHDIGDREHRRRILLAIERRREAVVAEFGVHRLCRVGDPGERAGLPRRHQPRIVDLKPGRQIVGDDDAAELRLRLGHLQHHDEALVLLGLAWIDRFAVERVIAALDLEAAARPPAPA